jgi:hypothetical protein
MHPGKVSGIMLGETFYWVDDTGRVSPKYPIKRGRRTSELLSWHQYFIICVFIFFRCLQPDFLLQAQEYSIDNKPITRSITPLHISISNGLTQTTWLFDV